MMSALSLIPSGRGFAAYLYGYVYLQLRSVKGPFLIRRNLLPEQITIPVILQIAAAI
jgi:hypothetical protein